MEASKVYFADFRTTLTENLQQKLWRLLDKAGMGTIDFDKKYAAIKMHFGEPGNLAFLRPNWAKTVADYVKAHGGKPFLTDCNTPCTSADVRTRSIIWIRLISTAFRRCPPAAMSSSATA